MSQREHGAHAGMQSAGQSIRVALLANASVHDVRVAARLVIQNQTHQHNAWACDQTWKIDQSPSLEQRLDSLVRCQGMDRDEPTLT